MDINTVSSPKQPALQNAVAPGSSNVLATDFETFLTMLTTQAKYQDPLEPLDSSDYSAQLAQFSMVEQQVNTNELMQKLLDALGTPDMSGAVDWIGKEALVTGPAKFDGSPVTIAPNPPVAADEVTLIVYDATGAEVQRVALPTSAESYAWQGIDDAGNAFSDGEYSFAIEAKAEGEVLLTEPAYTYSRITEARIEGGQVLLVLDRGFMIEAGNVVGLREVPV